MLAGFGFFFCLLCGYYLLRPLRDAMGLVGGANSLPWLFTATFVAMLALVPVFGALAARLAPPRLPTVRPHAPARRPASPASVVP